MITEQIDKLYDEIVEKYGQAGAAMYFKEMLKLAATRDNKYTEYHINSELEND